MKKQLLFLSAAALLLASCGNNNSSGSSSASSGDGEPTYGDSSSGQKADSSNDPAGGSSVAPDSSDGGISEAFPAEELTAFLSASGVTGVTIPAYEATSYIYEFSVESEGGYIYSEYETLAEALAVEENYVAALENAGFDIDDSDYDENGYYATDENGLVGLSFFGWDNGIISPYFYISIEILDQPSDTFPIDQINEWLAFWEMDNVVIPAYEADLYVYEYIDFFTYSVYSEVADAAAASSITAAYAKALTDAGWVSDEYYGIYLDPTEQVYVSFEPETADGKTYFVLTINIYYEDEPFEYDSSDAFPTAELLKFLNDIGYDGSGSIPAYESSNYGYEASQDEYGDYFMIISIGEDADEVFGLEADYAATLETFGFDVDDSDYDDYGYYAYWEDGLALQFFADKEAFGDFYFCVYVYLDDYVPSLPVGGEESFDEAVPGEESTIGFDTILDLIDVDAEEHAYAKWNNGAFSFTVQQGTSTINVGNFQEDGSHFLADSLRVYASQAITITAEIPFASVAFSADGTKYANALAGATATAGAFTVDDQLVTLDFEAPVTAVTITLSAQVRLNDVSVTFAAAN